MLSLLVLWAVMGLMFFVVGVPLVYWFNLNTALSRAEDRVFVAIWLGIVVMANLLLLASLITPINLYVTLLIFAIQALPSASTRCGPVLRGLSLSRGVGLALFVAVLLVAFVFATSLSRLVDTGAYHQQLVKWLSAYGSVPGLAHIKTHFGFTSSWFALAAPLWTGELMDRLVVGLNGFIFLLLSLQVVVVVGRIFDRSCCISDWFFIATFVLFCRYSFTNMLYSLSPDVPTTFLIMVVAWLIIVLEEKKGVWHTDGAKWPGAAVVVLAAGAVTVKLSALPLLAVAGLYYLYARGFSMRKAYTLIGIVAPFMIVLMSVSTVTSGCPLFPAPYFCTDLSWSVGSGSARQMSNTIYEFAKWVGSAPADATNINWLWHTPPNRNYFNDKPLMLGLLIVNVLCGLWLYKMRKRSEGQIYRYVLLVALVGEIFTLVKAPHLRFGIGFFIIIPSLACAMMMVALSSWTWQGMAYMSRFKVLPMFAVAYLAITPMVDTFRQLFYYNAPPALIVMALAGHASVWWIWPRTPSYPRSLASVEANGFLYVYPDDPRDGTLCWGAPLPCAAGVLDENVRLRDPSVGLSKGFYKARS